MYISLVKMIILARVLMRIFNAMADRNVPTGTTNVIVMVSVHSVSGGLKGHFRFS